MSLLNKNTLSLLTGLSLFAGTGAFALDRTCTTDPIPHAAIQFDLGSSYLPDSDRVQLRNLVQLVRKQDYIGEAIVAAWSDQNLPKSGHELTAGDQALARRRAETIARFLMDDMGVQSVDSYNMAETANWLAKAFNTGPSELKATFSKKGALNPVNQAQLGVIKSEGAPSEAVVVIQCQEQISGNARPKLPSEKGDM